ncbi:hypothetical protein K466DRAFT_603760 [Polyporus arcularius HHB13444]|uniref:Uncharacterized protein n=1 Tax=Polyporus arcularius HHB13444 TaxID=1314778 RepID=A0A5C3NY57_9APHY|nr:hypothetical protein K466DRAFT_603760 [Polyporus arcularius HHB13444]
MSQDAAHAHGETSRSLEGDPEQPESTIFLLQFADPDELRMHNMRKPKDRYQVAPNGKLTLVARTKGSRLDVSEMEGCSSGSSSMCYGLIMLATVTSAMAERYLEIERDIREGRRKQPLTQPELAFRDHVREWLILLDPDRFGPILPVIGALQADKAISSAVSVQRLCFFLKALQRESEATGMPQVSTLDDLMAIKMVQGLHLHYSLTIVKDVCYRSYPWCKVDLLMYRDTPGEPERHARGLSDDKKPKYKSPSAILCGIYDIGVVPERVLQDLRELETPLAVGVAVGITHSSTLEECAEEAIEFIRQLGKYPPELENWDELAKYCVSKHMREAANGTLGAVKKVPARVVYDILYALVQTVRRAPPSSG